jgi:hypothetical protein
VFRRPIETWTENWALDHSEPCRPPPAGRHRLARSLDDYRDQHRLVDKDHAVGLRREIDVGVEPVLRQARDRVVAVDHDRLRHIARRSGGEPRQAGREGKQQ